MTKEKIVIKRPLWSDLSHELAALDVTPRFLVERFGTDSVAMVKILEWLNDHNVYLHCQLLWNGKPVENPLQSDMPQRQLLAFFRRKFSRVKEFQGMFEGPKPKVKKRCKVCNRELASSNKTGYCMRDLVGSGRGYRLREEI